MSVMTPDIETRNALFDAVDRNDMATLRELAADKNADLGATRSYFHGGRDFSYGHHTLLMRALYKENLPMAKGVLDLGVDIDQQNAQLETALIQAVKDCSNFPRAFSMERGVNDWPFAERFVQFLIDEGANPFIKDKYGRTAKDLARGHLKVTLEAAEKAYLENNRPARRPSAPKAPLSTV